MLIYALNVRVRVITGTKQWTIVLATLQMRILVMRMGVAGKHAGSRV